MYLLIGKRLLDLAITTLALVLLAPVLLGLWIVVFLGIGHPAILRQTRAGRDGRPFVLLKFRTMTDERGENGELLPDGERLTRLGRALRQASLDELPELLNVLKGDMSLVGPRPLFVRYVDRYSPEQKRRLEVKPGVTGWAQVNGRNLSTWDDRLQHDVWYVDHASLGLDVIIMVRTLSAVLSARGISAAGHATMPEFEGSGGSRPLSDSIRTGTGR